MSASNTSTEMSRERQRQARSYARYGEIMFVIGLGVGVLYVLFWLFSGLTVGVRNLASGWTAGLPAQAAYAVSVAIYLAIFMLGYDLLRLPLSIHRYITSRRYGLSVQTPGSWVLDWLKGTALSFALSIPLGVGMYALLALWPDGWWLLAAIAFLFITVVMATIAPIIFLPLFYKLKPLDDENLVHRLIQLSERAGTRVRGVFRIDFSAKTTAANAMLMGMGQTRRIALSDTLLAHYTPDEIETILAHELGHHVHRDIPKGLLLETVLTLASLYLANLFLRWGINIAGFNGITDIAAFPLLAIATGVFGFLVMPLTNAYTRHIEYQADEYAMASTGKPDAFINAMRRLANQNLAEIEPNPIVEWLLYDHPAIGKRIRHGEEFKQRAA